MEEEMITITKKEYDGLVHDSNWYQALEEAGIDNWHGWDLAREIYEDLFGEE